MRCEEWKKTVLPDKKEAEKEDANIAMNMLII